MHKRLHIVLALLAFLLGAAFLASPARADDFKEGTYVLWGADNKPEWMLTFRRSPKVPTLYTVTGTVGSLITTQVKGAYSSNSNRLTAQTWQPEVLGYKSPWGLVEIDGEWDKSKNIFNARYKGGKTNELKWSYDATGMNAMIASVKELHVDPLEGGKPITGHLLIDVTELDRPSELKVALTTRSNTTSTGPAATRIMQVGAKGQYRLDLANLGLTARTGDDSMTFDVYLQNMTTGWGLVVDFSKTFDVKQVRNGSTITGFYAQPINIDTGKGVSFTYSFYLSPDVAATVERKFPLRARVRITADGGSGAIDIPEERIDLVVPSNPGWAQHTQRVNIGALTSGVYRARVSIEGAITAPFAEEFIFSVEDPDPEYKQPIPVEPVFSATLTLDKANVKPGEAVRLDAALSHTKGDELQGASATFELIDPSGAVVQTRTRSLWLDRDKTLTKSFNILSRTPGRHVVRVRLGSTRSWTWQGEASFIVDKPEPVAVKPKPPVAPPPKAQGDVWVRNAPTLTDGNGTQKFVGGLTTGINSITYTREHEGKQWTNTISWNTPPAVIHDEDMITLTVNCSTNTWPYVSAKWYWTCSHRSEVTGVQTASNSPDWRKDSPHAGSLTFKHRNSEYCANGPSFKIYAGQSGNDQGPYNTQWVTWTYRKLGAGEKPPEENPADPPTPPNDPTDTVSNEPPPPPTMVGADPDEAEDEAAVIRAWLDTSMITLVAGEPSKIVDLNIEGFRTNTSDRVEVSFPQGSDSQVSLPGQIVAGAGNHSYDPANMNRPTHRDGYFFAARETAPGGEFTIDIVVRQKKAGAVTLKLNVKVIPKKRPPKPNVGPGAGPNPPTPPNNPTRPQNPATPPTRPAITPKPPDPDESGPPRDFSGTWKTNRGQVSITQHDDRVEGHYPGGRIRGEIKGRVVRFQMDENPTTPFPGFGRLKINPDGNSFEGVFGGDPGLDDGTRPWSGERAGPPGNENAAKPDNRPDDKPRQPDEKPAPPADGDRPATRGGPDLAPGKLSAAQWDPETNRGATTTVTPDGITVAIARDSDGAAATFGKDPMDGNFDLTVDYTLQDWKADQDSLLTAAIYLGTKMTKDHGAMVCVARTSDPAEGPDKIIVDFPGSEKMPERRAVAGNEGRLRIRRSLDTWTIYQWENGGWAEMTRFTSTHMRGPVYLGVGVERQGALGGKAFFKPQPSSVK